MPLIDNVKSSLSSLSPTGAGNVGTAVVSSSKAIKLARLPPPVIDEISKLAKKLLENDPSDHILKALKSHLLSVRLQAMAELYDLIVKHLTKGKQFDGNSFELILAQVGVEALLLIPACADSYRRHLNNGGTAATFKDYVLSRKNRELYAALKGALINDQFLKLLGVTEETLFTFANYNLRSSPAARDEVLVSLRRLLGGGMPPELFFNILFSKAGQNLVPADKRDDLIDAFQKLLQTGKLPQSVTAAEAARIFKIANRSALQGPLGELLVLERQIDRAKALAAARGEPVYILLRANLDSVRTSLARKERQMMEGLPDRVDLPDDPNGLAKAEAEFEKQAAGVTAERFSQEYTDGLIVSFDGKGGIKGLVWTEVKTDQRGITNGLAQFDRNTEDIDQIVALNTDAVVKVEKGGQVLFLSLEDAAKASGGSVVDEMLVLAEKADVVARLEALEKKQSSFDRLTPADVADLNKIRAELLFRSFKAMARELYVGAEQKAKLAAEEIGNVRIRDYGHDYVTVVDVVATLLATMGFKNL